MRRTQPTTTSLAGKSTAVDPVTLEPGAAKSASAAPATLLEGIRDALPIVVGYLPIAFSFGVAATDFGFPVEAAVLLSAVVYAGASQFLALPLLAGGTPLLVCCVTLLAMNLRHLLYGPALLDRAGAQARYSWGWAFGLTDEVFATAIGLLANGARGWGERWIFGLGAASYLAWVVGTWAGAQAGGGALAAYPAVEAALGFMLPALFLSLLLAILNRKQLPVVTTAGAVCALLALVANVTVGILAGMVVGAVVGAWGARPVPVKERS